MAIIHNLIARFRADTAAFDRNVKKSRSHMTRFGRDVQRMGKQMLAIAGVGGGLYMVNRGLRGAIRAFMEQEKAERALMAATNRSIGSFKKYAAQIQKATIYGDEQILSQMAYAKNLGVSTEKLQEATTAAVGLAAKFRLDLATSMMLVGRASQGQTQMLTRYGIAIKESLSSQEKFNALLKIGAENFHLAEAETETLEGAWKQFSNNAGDFAEDIVKAYLDVAKGLKDVAQHYSGVEKSAKKAAEGMRNLKKNMPNFQANMPGLFYYPSPKAGPKKGIEPDPLGAEMEGFMVKQKKYLAGLQEQRKAAEAVGAIRQKYIPALNTEIELTGRLGEARQHARQVMKLENELKTAILDKTKQGISLMKEQKSLLKDLEKSQRLAKIADTIGDSFAGAFEDMIFEAKKFRDVLNSIVRDISRSVMKNLIFDRLGMSISGAIGNMFGMTPATEAHSGGKVGSIGVSRKVPTMAFAGAPRLHGGFAGDEYPAILQRGEQVIPRGGGGAGSDRNVTIINQSGTPLRQEGEPMFDGKQLIITVVADDIQSGGTLRKLFQGLKK